MLFCEVFLGPENDPRKGDPVFGHFRAQARNQMSHRMEAVSRDRAAQRRPIMLTTQPPAHITTKQTEKDTRQRGKKRREKTEERRHQEGGQKGDERHETRELQKNTDAERREKRQRD